MESAIRLSVNSKIIDKNCSGRREFFASGWSAQSLSATELAKSINAGYAFGPQFKDGVRKGVNFVAAGFVAIDADGSLTLEAALSDPFVRAYGTLVYLTPSHQTDGKDHFRIVFATEKPILTGARFRLALLGLAKKFNTDAKIADAARILFGSKGSNPIILGHILPNKELTALIRLGRQADQARRSHRVTGDATVTDELQVTGAERGANNFDPSLVIRTARLGSLPANELSSGTAIFCPFHDDQNPSAFTVQSKGGNVGIHCKACGKTWWPEGAKALDYDFYYFDSFTKRLAENLPRAKAEAIAQGKVPRDKDARVINARYLPDLELRDGVVLVKSPKGTGKTTTFKKLVEKAKKRKKSVLLIGHRQFLLRELAAKLGLVCYLDEPAFGGSTGESRPDYYAISIDSLPKRLQQPRPYDIVIVDECEQVFSHVTAKTVRNPHAVMTRLQGYIGDARSLYLFDADLNRVTLNFVASSRKKDESQPTLLILNTYIADNRVCELYPRPADLIVDLIENARAGKRLFVACNSKRRAKLLAKMLKKELGADARVLLITADEKIEQEVQDFLSDIPTKILQYSAVVASPAIGTGIDISFPESAQEIDVVYGFFNSGINSHYDIDQQLGRVRNPKEVKVWVCGRRSYFEIELDAIKRDVVQRGDAHPAVTVFDMATGLPVVNLKDPLLTLQATAYQAQRASQNRMKEYFIRHKELNGWTIVRKEVQETAGKIDLQERLTRLKDEIEQEYIGAVMNAEMIDEGTWKDHFDRKAAGQPIGKAAIHEMVKFEIRHFYNQPVTPDLIALDDYGRYRDSIMRYESLHIHNPSYLELLHLQWQTYQSKKVDLATLFGSRPLRSLECILLASGLVDDKGICPHKVITKADLKDFLAFCDERRVTIEHDLDFHLRNDRHRDPVKTLNRCLDVVGLAMDCLGKTRKGNEGAIYRYRLDPDRYESIRKIVARRKVGSRCSLPEVLEPPRAPKRNKPVPDCQPIDIDSLFEPTEL